jgi:HK97 family phage major capsid protein
MEKTVEEMALEVKNSFNKQHDEVKALAEKALAESVKGVEMSQATKETVDAALTALNEAKGQLDSLEQKLDRRGSEVNRTFTAGQRLVESEEFKSFTSQNRPKGRVVIDVKDISSLTTDAAGSVGALIENQQVAGSMLPQRQMTIRSLLASGQTNSNTIEYDREKVFTNSAATVADGALKPQSELQFEEATATVRTIAHWMRVNVQTLADAPALSSIIDQRLRYGLMLAEEAQLLNGSGTGQNLSGLVTSATAYSGAFTPPAVSTMLDTIRLAMLQTSLAEYAPTGIVLNPTDWAYMEMLKDANNLYLIGNPQGVVQPTLWGLPVVATQAMTVDKFLVGAFNMAAQIFDRQNATVEVSTEDQDNFVKNKVTIRAEQRLALAIYRPQALVYGDLGRVA